MRRKLVRVGCTILAGRRTLLRLGLWKIYYSLLDNISMVLVCAMLASFKGKINLTSWGDCKLPIDMTIMHGVKIFMIVQLTVSCHAIT
jgi:hypothetical protein